MAVAAPVIVPHAMNALAAEAAPVVESAAPKNAGAPVSIVSCRGYDAKEVRAAMKQSFDLIGGIGSLVKNKTVTVKINLTGTDFKNVFGRPAGEVYITHCATALALTALLFDAGARRVRFVESTNSKSDLEETLGWANWNIKALEALGKVEFENTRNLGSGKKYAEMKVPGGGLMFSSLQFNHCYEETDVMVSLCKLKQHLTCGVTLSMKNLFGITPNALYGSEAGSEDALAGRDPIHSPGEPSDPWYGRIKMPGFKFTKDNQPTDQCIRVPRTVTDICGARPIHLAIIDGIVSMSGAEGPWYEGVKLVKPGVLIAGLDPVATDAVGAGVMGAADPRAKRGVAPFGHCENHLLMAEKAGLGVADLSKIDVRGLTIAKARFPFPLMRLG
ncbi:MAG: DUF362 domain-containing protein [Candidatus Sumerlaeota bacterium]|nr:DUF362 domain-containing protein [Candidatus Sumerlaeota bacterium]